MRLTIIPSDRSIGIDGKFLLNIQQDLSWIPQNIHAVQWNQTRGEVEFNDGSPNQKIEDLGIYSQAIEDYNSELLRIKQEKEAIAAAKEAARDYWKELRGLRNAKLFDCDWTQNRDVMLSNDNEWKLYRQKLRDLPDKVVDPKPLVLDSSHPDWPKQPK